MLCRNLSCICEKVLSLPFWHHKFSNDQEVGRGKIGIGLSLCDLRARCQRGLGAERVLAVSDLLSHTESIAQKWCHKSSWP